jgi:limonene-1,2-epoxide hydrolase
MPAGLLVATAGIYSGYTAMNAPFSGFLSRYSVPILLLLLGALLLFADQEWQFQRSIFVLAAIAFATVQVVLTMEARSGGRPIPPAAGVRTETGGIIGEMEMVQVARSFVDAINAHNPNAIVALTTPDHRFIDSLGNTTPPVKLRAAWHGYFRLITNYHIEVERWISDGTTVMAYGTASGNYNRTDWSIPAAWRAVIRDGKVAEWQVYADNGELRELMKQ